MAIPENLRNTEKRYEFVLLFDIRDGNPNGDPDAGNMPRIDPETMHGIVTDVALKRKIRDYVDIVKGKPIFIQSKAALNSLIREAFEKVGVQPPSIELDDPDLIDWFSKNPIEGFDIEDGSLVYGGESTKSNDILAELTEGLGDTDEQDLMSKLKDIANKLAAVAKNRKISPGKRDEAREWMCKEYYDIRMFGAVLQTGLNAGQVRGPVQLTFARSIDPVFSVDCAITRKARTTTERMRTGSTEMGRKPVVPYGLYRAHGYYNPYLAAQTGVQPEDLEILWEALTNLFQVDRSAARTETAVQGLYVFTHDSKLGNHPAHKLFQQVKVRVREGVETPRSFDDYEVIVPDDSELPAGVTLARLVG